MTNPPEQVPALVVVDSRNMWGETRRQYGVGAQVDVAGIAPALAPYGFDVVHSYIGLATESGSKRPSARLTQALDVNRRYAEEVERSGLATVLNGRLAERNRELEEKLVDVLCAIQIARSAHDIVSGRTSARAIVVMSEDMDLIPAYKFAQDLGVPVFASACATVDTRPDASWLLLTEPTLRQMTRRPRGRLAGTELRAQLARWLSSPTKYRMTFTVVADEGARIRLSHNSGAIGYWHDAPASADRRPSAKHDLWVTGVEPCSSERDFPLLAVSHSPGHTSAWPPRGLLEGTVTRWTAPTRLQVDLGAAGTRSCSAVAGSYMPGNRVLVHEDRSRSQSAWRLVGRLDEPRATPGWASPAAPRLARCLSSADSPGASTRAVLLDDEAEVALQPPGRDVPKDGDIYAVVPIAHLPQADGSLRVVTVAVTSGLGIG